MRWRHHEGFMAAVAASRIESFRVRLLTAAIAKSPHIEHTTTTGVYYHQKNLHATGNDRSCQGSRASFWSVGLGHPEDPKATSPATWPPSTDKWTKPSVPVPDEPSTAPGNARGVGSFLSTSGWLGDCRLTT